MTFSEIERAINSKKRVAKEQRKERAIFDYTLANLIGRNVARLYSSSITMPTLSAAYPDLFDAKEEQEIIKEKAQEVSAIRFRLFASAHNQKIKGASE